MTHAVMLKGIVVGMVKNGKKETGLIVLVL